MKIFLDMDGVLSNFNLGIYQKTGYWLDDLSQNEKYAIFNGLRDSDFFSSLDPYPIANEIVNTVVRLFGSYSILSSPFKDDWHNSFTHKRNWIKTHINHQPDEIIVIPWKEKYADPSAILIDDQEKNLVRWQSR